MSNPYDRIRSELEKAEQAAAADSLPHWRNIIDEASRVLDEQLAKAVVDDEISIRAAGASAGLTENAVGPRLARTSLLAPYARPDGRVTAEDVRRARYDKASGQSQAASVPPQPMRFKPRRQS